MSGGVNRNQSTNDEIQPSGISSNKDLFSEKRTIYLYKKNRVIFRLRARYGISLSKLSKTVCCILRRLTGCSALRHILLWTRFPGLKRRPINSDADLRRAFCHGRNAHIDVIEPARNDLSDLSANVFGKSSNKLDGSHQSITLNRHQIDLKKSKKREQLASILVAIARDPSRSSLLAKMRKRHKNNPRILRVLEILKPDERTDIDKHT